MIDILRVIAVLLAAAVIGNWFMSELRKTKAQGKPIYKAYLTTPGILIICIVLGLPILVWMMKH